MHSVGTIASYTVASYRDAQAQLWDDLVARSCMGTFLHTRKFLSYHGNRFHDYSLVLFENDKLTGVFPAAISSTDDSVVFSHPGTTYGGLVHDGSITGEKSVLALNSIIDHYRRFHNFRKLVYYPTPHIYHSTPSSDDVYALFSLGAVRHRLAVSSATDLTGPVMLSRGRRSGLNAAKRSRLSIAHGAEHLERFWNIIESLLNDKYSTKPVHSLQEISHLRALFPENIEVITAWLDNEIASGVVIFHTPTVAHVQYMASNIIGHQTNALSLVLHTGMNLARLRGARYFDFGTSMQDNGPFLNTGLHRYKSSFGAGAVLYESFAVDLQ